METKINKKDDGTIELTITIPWSDVKKTYTEIVNKSIQNVEVKGFRKGKAPRKLAEKKLDAEKIWQQVLEKVIPEFYSKTLQQQQIKPIITPQIQLLKAAPDNDLEFKATTAEAPEVKLGEYKKALSELKGKQSSKIWTPKGAGEVKKQVSRAAANAALSSTLRDEPSGSDSNENRRSSDARTNFSSEKNVGGGGGKSGSGKVTLDQILNKLLKTVKITIPAILIEKQTNQQLTQLLDQVKQVGMTIQQYAQSKGKTPQQLREEVAKEAKKVLQLEFVLQKIADVEKITVEDKEIDEFISKTEDEKEKKALQNQRYNIASVLRRQKTLQSLLN